MTKVIYFPMALANHLAQKPQARLHRLLGGPEENIHQQLSGLDALRKYLP
jgi:hypothetical protein